MRGMRTGFLVLVLFIFYCFEAGAFLVVAPWNRVWDAVVVQMPVSVLRGMLLTPSFRGAVSGFGLVHLLWAVHDLRLVLARRRLLRPGPGDEG